MTLVGDLAPWLLLYAVPAAPTALWAWLQGAPRAQVVLAGVFWPMFWIVILFTG